MRHGKTILAAAIILAGLSSSASAQAFGVAGASGNAFSGGLGVGGLGINQTYTGFSGGYGGFNTGYSNFGLNNGAYSSGYGAFSNSYINPYNGPNYVPRPLPQTQNNMFGLMNTIRTQTGGGNSYRYGYGPATGGRRR